MEHRNRTILILCTAAVIVAAVLSSFGLSLFAPDTAKIVLPSGTASPTPGVTPGGGEGSGLVRVEVTPETVQSVIEKTLVRPTSYYREVTVTDSWGEGRSSSTTARVWVDGGWTKVEATWPSGAVRRTIVGEGTLWLWYNSDQTVVKGPADGGSADLEGQRIPTYEDVLALDKAQIQSAGYEERGGLRCIYVETAADALGYRDRYWVSVDSGLLTAAETYSGDELVYSMSAYGLERTIPSGTRFSLPDGTVLHTVGSDVSPDPAPAAAPG